MTEKQSYQCSQCGKPAVPNIRYLACVSTSRWEKLNYPAPNSFVTTKDDIKIWKVCLCDSCMPSSYKVYLTNHRKRMTKQLGWCFFLLVVGALGMFLNKIDALASRLKIMNEIFGFAMFVALFIGIVGVPYGIVSVILYSGRLRRLNQTGIIPDKNKEKSFVGEGERILKEMENKQSDVMNSEYPLPQFIELKDLILNASEKKKIINKEFGERARSILAVGNTIEELKAALSSEWKAVLNAKTN